jgi:hypothetical protein
VSGKHAPVGERFWRFVSPEPNSGCWLWAGCIAPDGYGQLRVRQPEGHRSINAHRIAWELHHGKVPEGLWVLHRCDVRHCVNPAHLFVGTPAQNTADMLSKGRAVWPYALKTECPNGHPYSGSNLVVRKDGWRTCRTCRNEGKRRRRQERVLADIVKRMG